MNILQRLADHARSRVAGAKMQRSTEELKAIARNLPGSGYSFEKALGKEGLSFICECKKASPSRGLIAPDFPYLTIAKEYELAGADAISVLTEPSEFLGSGRYLEEIAASVSVPCLRKDFTVDEYMIYEAKLMGAEAVLLICAISSREQLKRYISVCDQLELSALVEAHDEDEIRTALECGARIIGVNNRNLKDFSVDTGHSAKLRELVPPGVLFVAESGIKNASDTEAMHRIGADAVLVGETLMRAEDKRKKLAELRGNL